jgi:protein-disulfide isomerase
MIIAAIAVVVVFVVIVAADFVTKSQGPAVVPTVAGIASSGRTQGDPKAPIAFLEFSDFQWPYCRDFALGAGRQIEASYVKTGKVNFTYRYYPVVDQGKIGESHWAAEAAECANQQSKFWEYHYLLFSKWTGEGVGNFTKDKLKQYAAAMEGLNTTTFNQCIDTDATASIVQTDVDTATRMGVSGTPTFFVNNRLLNIQTLDYSSFGRTFDSLLK